MAAVTAMCVTFMEVAQRKKSELHQSATQQIKRLVNITMQSGKKLRWSCQNLLLVAKADEGELRSDVQQMAHATKWR